MKKKNDPRAIQSRVFFLSVITKIVVRNGSLHFDTCTTRDCFLVFVNLYTLTFHNDGITVDAVATVVTQWQRDTEVAMNSSTGSATQWMTRLHLDNTLTKQTALALDDVGQIAT